MLTVFLLLCASGLAQKTDSFAGEYAGKEFTLSVRESGNEYSGSLHFQGQSLPFTATANGATLQGSFQTPGAQFSFALRREGSALVLATAGEEYKLEATAVRAVNPLAKRPAAAQPGNSIVGSWRHATGSLTFDAAGAGTSNGIPFRYQIEGNVLTLSDSQASLRFTHVLEGGTLRLTGPTGVELQLTRATESKAAVGSVAQDLSGKWCCVSNVNATGSGARATNQCFTLHPNGRYEYYGETDSYGPNGGATSQSSDSGTWSGTDTALTARSASGRVSTNQLQKRNHPKTSDPMLVLDGQTFVTYHQKAPWR